MKNKSIVINVCKIGFVSWGILSAFLIFSFIAEGSAFFSMGQIKTDTGELCSDFEKNHEIINIRCDENNHSIELSFCYKGILDADKICSGNPSSPEFNWPPFEFFTILFLIVNCINWHLWFVALNRHFGWFVFEFKSCTKH